MTSHHQRLADHSAADCPAAPPPGGGAGRCTDSHHDISGILRANSCRLVNDRFKEPQRPFERKVPKMAAEQARDIRLRQPGRLGLLSLTTKRLSRLACAPGLAVRAWLPGPASVVGPERRGRAPGDEDFAGPVLSSFRLRMMASIRLTSFAFSRCSSASGRPRSANTLPLPLSTIPLRGTPAVSAGRGGLASRCQGERAGRRPSAGHLSMRHQCDSGCVKTGAFVTY